MARSACAKVRRLGAWPVMRCLFSGSSNAGASGCRARIRRNNPSSVGDTLVWITGSLGLRDRAVPPGLRKIPRQGGGFRTFYPIPAGDPLLLNVKKRDGVKPGHQRAVQRAHRRDEGAMVPRRQHGGNHRIDGVVFGAHVVSAALIVRSLASPIEKLLVARRKRLIPAVLDHVEIEAETALIELNGVHRPYRCLDARALEVARKGEGYAFLIAGSHQNFEGEGRPGRTLPQHGAVEVVARLRQQIQRAAQRGAIAARAVGDGKAVAAIENVGRDLRYEGFQELALALVGGAAIRRQFGTRKVARRAAVEPKEVIPVDPFEIEQQRQRLAYADVGKHRPSRVEDEVFGRLRRSGLDSVADHLAAAGSRKIISVVPAQRFGLDTEVVKAALEGLEPAVGLAIEVEPDLVEIPQAPVDREVASPIVGVARQRHARAGVHGADTVWPGTDRSRHRGLLESRDIDGMPRQYRHQAEDQWQFAIRGAAKIEPHGERVEGFGLCDFGIILAMVGTPFVTQQGPREQNVLGSDLLPIGKTRLRVEAERDITPGVVGLHAFGQKSVQCE